MESREAEMSPDVGSEGASAAMVQLGFVYICTLPETVVQQVFNLLVSCSSSS